MPAAFLARRSVTYCCLCCWRAVRWSGVIEPTIADERLKANLSCVCPAEILATELLLFHEMEEGAEERRHVWPKVEAIFHPIGPSCP